MSETQIDNSWTSTFRDMNKYFQHEYDRDFKGNKPFNFAALKQKRNIRNQRYRYLRGNYTDDKSKKDSDSLNKNEDRKLLRRTPIPRYVRKNQHSEAEHKIDYLDSDSKRTLLTEVKNLKNIEKILLNDNLLKNAGPKTTATGNRLGSENENSESIIYPIDNLFAENQPQDKLIADPETKIEIFPEKLNKNILVPKTSKQQYSFRSTLMNRQGFSNESLNKVSYDQIQYSKFPMNLSKDNHFLENNYYSMTLDELNKKSRKVIHYSKTGKGLISKIAKQESNLNAEISQLKYIKEINDNDGYFSDTTDYVASAGLSENIFNGDNIESFLTSKSKLKTNFLESEKKSLAHGKKDNSSSKIILKNDQKEKIDKDTLTYENFSDNNNFDFPFLNRNKDSNSVSEYCNPVDHSKCYKENDPSLQSKKCYSSYFSKFKNSQIHENSNCRFTLDKPFYSTKNSFHVKNESIDRNKFKRYQPIPNYSCDDSFIKSRCTANKSSNLPFCPRCLRCHFMCQTSSRPNQKSFSGWLNMNINEKKVTDSTDYSRESFLPTFNHDYINSNNVHIYNRNNWTNFGTFNQQDHDTLEQCNCQNLSIGNFRFSNRIPNNTSSNQFTELDLRVFCRGKLIYDPDLREQKI